MIKLLEHMLKVDGKQIDPKMKCTISFYDRKEEPRIFKPGEYVTLKDIKNFRIPDKYLVNPECMRLKGAFKFAHKHKGTFTVGILRNHRGAGDVIIASVIAKALKFVYKDKAQVWFCVKSEHACLLENNPHIDKVFTDEKEMMKENPDIRVDTNVIDFRVKLKEFEEAGKPLKNRTDIYLEELELYVENKTPVYVVTDDEKKWAKNELNKLGYNSKKRIVGLQLEGSVKSRTYPYMKEVGELLKKEGYQIFYLDEKSDGKFKYGFREIASLMNEMYMIITPNSFMYHLAGALGKRGLVLFGSCDGNIWVEDYEKILPVEIPCPFGQKKCWWSFRCLEGDSLKEKENKGVPKCLSDITPEQVVENMEKHKNVKKVLVLALTYDFLNLTKDMVDSVRSFHDYDIFIVDNESKDGTVEWLKNRGIDFVSKKTSVAQAENIGLEKAYEGGYDYCLVCNNDIILSADYIDVLVEIAERRKSYMTTGKVITKDSKEMLDFEKLKDKNIELPIQVMEAGDYSAILMSRECIEKVGKFDERFGPRYQEDEDHMLRVRLSGHDIIRTYSTSFLHMLGQVCKKNRKESIYHEDNWARNVRKFKKKWGIDLYAERNKLKHLNEIKNNVPNWNDMIHIPITDKKVKFDIHNITTPINIIKEAIKNNKKSRVAVVRRMGGAGDILFISIIAKTLKNIFGAKIEIDYAIPKNLFSLLKYNKHIDKVVDYHDFHGGDYDFVFHTTDYEYEQEMLQVEETGWIQKARTEMFVELVGIDADLKPDFDLTNDEIKWGKKQWEFAGDKKKIAVSIKGSNKMKEWIRFDAFIEMLERKGYAVIVLERMEGEKYKYSLREAGAIINASDAVVSPDSAFSNIAGCLGIPVVTIFPNRNGKIFERMFPSMIAVQGECPHFDDRNYCDYKVPCFEGSIQDYRKKEQIKPPKCLNGLSLGKVFEALRRALNEA